MSSPVEAWEGPGHLYGHRPCSTHAPGGLLCARWTHCWGDQGGEPGTSSLLGGPQCVCVGVGRRKVWGTGLGGLHCLSEPRETLEALAPEGLCPRAPCSSVP